MSMEEVMARGQNLTTTSTVVIAEVNVIQLGVSKVHTFIRYIQSQTIRPVDFGCNNGGPVGTVESHPLNPWIFTPVSPEKPSCTANINKYLAHAQSYRSNIVTKIELLTRD